jgi:hypothetical protein
MIGLPVDVAFGLARIACECGAQAVIDDDIFHTVKYTLICRPINVIVCPHLLHQKCTIHEVCAHKVMLNDEWMYGMQTMDSADPYANWKRMFQCFLDSNMKEGRSLLSSYVNAYNEDSVAQWLTTVTFEQCPPLPVVVNDTGKYALPIITPWLQLTDRIICSSSQHSPSCSSPPQQEQQQQSNFGAVPLLLRGRSPPSLYHHIHPHSISSFSRSLSENQILVAKFPNLNRVVVHNTATIASSSQHSLHTLPSIAALSCDSKDVPVLSSRHNSDLDQEVL